MTRSGSSGSRTGDRPVKHPAAPVDVPACSCCGEPAVIYQPVSRRHLCGIHLVRDVEKRVASTINEAGQIHAGDRIAVALSGGKDSTALLVILSRLLPAWPGADLVAITVDEGIAGYRTDTIRAAEALTGRLGVDHRIVSFRDLVGADLDTLLAGRETEACTICGILRKKALTDAARTAGATAIATGHNLDDEAQSMLMNAFRGISPARQEHRYRPVGPVPPEDQTPCCCNGEGDRGLSFCAGSFFRAARMPVHEIRTACRSTEPACRIGGPASRDDAASRGQQKKYRTVLCGDTGHGIPAPLPGVRRPLLRRNLPGLPAPALTGKVKGRPVPVQGECR